MEASSLEARTTESGGNWKPGGKKGFQPRKMYSCLCKKLEKLKCWIKNFGGNTEFAVFGVYGSKTLGMGAWGGGASWFRYFCFSIAGLAVASHTLDQNDLMAIDQIIKP